MGPVLTIIGWIARKAVGLNFYLFEMVAVLLAITVVQFTVSNRKANWFHGVQFAALYIILSICAFYQPDY